MHCYDVVHGGWKLSSGMFAGIHEDEDVDKKPYSAILAHFFVNQLIVYAEYDIFQVSIIFDVRPLHEIYVQLHDLAGYNGSNKCP